MKKMLLAIVLLGAGRVVAQEKEDLSSGASAKEEVTLRCPAAPAGNPPRLRLEGTASFPNATVLTLTLQRLDERFVSGRLQPGATLASTARKAVHSHKFSFEAVVGSPGGYRAIAELSDEDQPPAVVATLRERTLARKWEFDFAAWGDDLAVQFERRLSEVDGFSDEGLKLIERFIAAAASLETWKELFPELMKQAVVFEKKLGQAEAFPLYPAAVGRIRSAIRRARDSAARMKITTDGMLGIEGSPSQRAAVPDPHVFGFDALRTEMEESGGLAGREFALWIIKDFRRSSGGRPELIQAVQKEARHPGVSPFADRLAGMLRGEEDPGALEKDIRKGAEEKKP